MFNKSENQKQEKHSEPSKHLTHEENTLVLHLVGKRCQSQCTTIAQLFITEPSRHQRWVKKYTGVLCFVKDNQKKSYFMRMFCLMSTKLVWEQEVYDELEISRVKPFLLTLEGDDRMVALNFAFNDEIELFLFISTSTIQRRRKRREERKATIAATNAHQVLQKDADKKKGKNKKKKTLTKADIGTPKNFIHVNHAGMEMIIKHAGITLTELNDPKTREFIYDFLKKNKCQSGPALKTEPLPATPPSLPPRNKGDSRPMSSAVAAPKPPNAANNFGTSPSARKPPPDFPAPPVPSSSPLPPPPTGAPPSRHQMKQRPLPPPPIQNARSDTFNSPPPAPPPFTGPVLGAPMPPPPPPAPLFESEEEVSQPIVKSDRPKPAPGNAFNDLMNSIKSGKALKPVESRQVNESPRVAAAGADTIAEALKRAMEIRRGTVADSESDGDGLDDDDEDEDWD